MMASQFKYNTYRRHCKQSGACKRNNTSDGYTLECPTAAHVIGTQQPCLCCHHTSPDKTQEQTGTVSSFV